MSHKNCLVTVLVLAVLTLPTILRADSDHQNVPLHFSHPLFNESPSPDTKIRIDYIYGNATGEEKFKTHTARLEAEYAIRPWISVETNIPYQFRNPNGARNKHNLGTIEVAVKLATFALSDHGVLLGGGIEFGLPTGNDSKEIGSSHVVEVEPYLDFGFKRDKLEVVGSLSSGIPVNENGHDEADVELGWNMSVLYHLGLRIQGLLEFDGERVFGGEESGTYVVNIAPGIKITPTDNQSLTIGVGASLPISDNQDAHQRLILSVFYHF